MLAPQDWAPRSKVVEEEAHGPLRMLPVQDTETNKRFQEIPAIDASQRELDFIFAEPLCSQRLDSTEMKCNCITEENQ